jgi:hypothetical protein
MNSSYRIALFCGLFPLVVGVSIFVLWLFTHWPWLMTAGMMTILAGIGFVVVGFLALDSFCWKYESPTSPSPPKRFNFPIALAIVATVVALVTRYTVTVFNSSQQPLQNVSVVGGGCDQSLGTILPDGKASCSLWPQHDGELRLHTVCGNTTHSDIIEGYVTNNMGGRAVVTFHPDETISVDHPKF